jgi:hypothetical protein
MALEDQTRQNLELAFKKLIPIIPIIAASPGLNLNLTICTVREHEFGLQKFLVFLDDVSRRGEQRS